MKLHPIWVLVLAGVIGACGMSFGEPPTIYGIHFWRESANLDCFNGKVGWVTELVQADTWAGIDFNRYKQEVNEGFAFLLRLNWGRAGTGACYGDDDCNWPNSVDEAQFASECAFWAEKCAPFTHIYVIGNEDGPIVSAFQKVRWAIHAVQPDAFVVAGAPGGYSGYGDLVDGFAAHTGSAGFADEVDSAYAGNKCKPLYITECGGDPPRYLGAMPGIFNDVGTWNQEHAHKVECANRFVYYEFGQEYSSQFLIPLWDGDYSEGTASSSYTNSYANPFIVITGIAAAPVTETSALVTWTTDLASTSQVEYWKDGERTQIVTPYLETQVTAHSVTLTGLQPGVNYLYQVKSYRSPHPWTISSPRTFAQIGPGTGTITGYVKDKSGVGVENAAVTRTPNGCTVKTGADGSYRFAGVAPGTHTVAVDHIGCNSHIRSGVAVFEGQTTNVDFSVTRKTNLLTNPGYEGGSQAGWTAYGDAMENRSGSWFGEISAHGGNWFTGKAGDGTYGNGGMYQRVAAQVGQRYLARLWSRVYRINCPYHIQYVRVGIDPSGGTNPASGTVQWSANDYAYFSADSVWRELVSPTVTASAGYVTVFLDYKMLGEGAYLTGWHICCFDEAALFGPAYDTVVCANVAAAKEVEDGAPVSLTGRVVTGTKAQLGDRLYIEDPDRASGIQVYLAATASSVVVGDVVTVTGTMTTRNGERAVEYPTVTKTGSQTPLVPLGSPGKALGGTDLEYQPGPPESGQRGVSGGYGVNSIGLLMRAWGEVKQEATGYLMIDDGSPSQLRVDVSRAVSKPVGTYVMVTGVLSLWDDSGLWKPLLVAREAGDVVEALGP